jgi:transcriptional regulator with XRE-family HTH domain
MTETSNPDGDSDNRDPDIQERSADQPPSWTAFGDYLRAQRRLARLSLRQLADMTRISNPYLSQVERGLHQPSVSVIKSLADALNLSAEALLAQAAGIDASAAPTDGGTEAAIRTDPRLTSSQKAALLAVYRSMVGEEGGP